MSSVCCPSCGSAVYPVQYLTEGERRAARRKTWRESKRRARIQQAFVPAVVPVPVEPVLPGLTSSHRYWLERFSMDEIRVLGSGLLMFDVTDSEEAAA